MPTFLFIRETQVVEQLRGANAGRLRELIQQISSQIGPIAPNRKAANASEKQFLQQFVHQAERVSYIQFRSFILTTSF